jgi:hypothetical protein
MFALAGGWATVAEWGNGLVGESVVWSSATVCPPREKAHCCEQPERQIATIATQAKVVCPRGVNIESRGSRTKMPNLWKDA